MTAPPRLSALREQLQSLDLEAILLSRPETISAFFEGAQISLGNRLEPAGRIGVLVRPNTLTVFGNRTEAHRFLLEEFGPQTSRSRLRSDFEEVVAVDWYDWDLQRCVTEYCDEHDITRQWAESFGPNAGECQRLVDSLIYPLQPVELEHLRFLGHCIAQTLEVAARTLTSSSTERGTSAFVHAQLINRGVLPDLVFVAFDDRIREFRHCQASETKLDTLAFLSITASHRGLFASATRLVSLGEPSDEVLADVQAANNIEATAIVSATHLASAQQTLVAIQEAYESAGRPEGWMEHHLGGLGGFRGRVSKLSPSAPWTHQAGQPFIYNPVFGFGKSEDTHVVDPASGKLVCLTRDSAWPLNSCMIPIDDNQAEVVQRPGILIRPAD